jgi:beta-1,4-mannosyltransferase
MKPLRVIHIPTYETDPCHRLLFDKMKLLGIDVRDGRMVQLFSIINISILFNVLSNFKVHIMHLHWQHPFLITKSRFGTIVKSLIFLSQILFIKSLGIKIFWTVHNLKNHDNRHEQLEIFFSSVLARYVHAIIVHCDAAKKNVERMYKISKNKIIVIPQESYKNAYKNYISKEGARDRLKFSAGDFIFLFLGLIRPYKGLVELVDSFKRMDGDAKLVIAGRPRDERLVDILKKKAEGNSNIRLIFQFIPEDEVQVYMNAADVVILPYRDVLNSGTAILGMSFGKPVIAPRIGCMPEIVTSANGFLYELDDEDGLLKVMKLAISERSELKQMGTHNLEFSERMDWSEAARLTCEAYKKCLKR